MSQAHIEQQHPGLGVVDPAPGAGPGPELKGEDDIPSDLSDEVKQALEADDFIVYGKASIEQYDVENQRLTMEALEGALDRFFDSEDAPGIISRAHQDVPVGRPVREHVLEEDTELVIDGERYAFDAGDTLRTEVKDADDDGRPELWLVSRLANDSELARETRYRALTDELNGFSVTVMPRAREHTAQGEDVTQLDLHAVTIGTDEQIKNKGSEFDVAEFKLFPGAVSEAVSALKQAALSTEMADNKDKSTIGRLLQRAGRDIEAEAEDDTTEDPDADQKSESGSGDDADTEAEDVESKGEDGTDAEGDEGDGTEPSPIMRAVEAGDLSAAEADTLQSASTKAGSDVVGTIVAAVTDGGLDVGDAVELINATEKADDEDDGDDDVDVDVDVDEEPDEDDEADAEGKADDPDESDEDDVEDKANVREVAELLADKYGLPADEVLADLESLEASDEKDDEGELKAAAAEAAESVADTIVEEKLDEITDQVVDQVSDQVDQKLEAAIDERELASMDDVGQKLEQKAEEALDQADTVGSPSPTTGGAEGSRTIGDVMNGDN